MKNPALIREAVTLAESWQTLASRQVSQFDRRFHRKMNKMLEHPQDKALLIEWMDQCFRSRRPERVAGQIVHLLNRYGLARFFTPSEKLLITFFKHIGVLAPRLSVPLFIRQIRRESRTVVIDGEPQAFHRHLSGRKQEGVDCICNLIGEVVLGEEEAESRMVKYTEALKHPDIEFLSIKLSTLYSQISAFDFEGTVDVLVDRLSRIYRAALDSGSPDGEVVKRLGKFVNLDMEEYRDLPITVEVFKRTLSRPEFKHLYAGIALQAYLPDSHLYQQDLTEWAKDRVRAGGAPIKIRLVKGANREMELTEADEKGWSLVTFSEKADTDANYKRMLHDALEPDRARAVHLAVASHNLFEIAYAVVLARANGCFEHLSVEMLEGMNESARMAIHEQTLPVRLYAPAVARDQFTNAIAYLVRRLDENTGEENFIRHSFGLKVDSPEWENQKRRFCESFERTNLKTDQSFRKQNRLIESDHESSGKATVDGSFRSEADTDFVLAQNRQWAEEIRRQWKFDKNSEPLQIPVVVAGGSVTDKREILRKSDRSQLPAERVIAECAMANVKDIESALSCGSEDPDGWRGLLPGERAERLRRVARLMRSRRDRLVGAAAAELGKVFTETDVEVSEAIDFLEFYALSTEYFDGFKHLETRGLGLGVVVPPWNFPVAIPVGGVAAALAAGNTVILKPASAAIVCAHELCQCFWEAGISRNTLQLLPCPGRMAGEHLITDQKVQFVILTGGESTARQMLRSRANLYLTAETGGKDATIVTAMADWDQAIRNICHSAFSNSGQKCSATSLLVLEREVYEDASFRRSLVDAAKSLPVGSPWDPRNRLGMLANPVSGALKRALETLEAGESWALAPEYVDDNPFLLRPCIKWGVRPGSFCHMTELFGPVLSVMVADDLDEAIERVNATGYGLTSGLESLDEREMQQWSEKIRAGNLYINRSTTGAIVLRQPFGGVGKSAIGAGRKVGTYSYISQFMDFTEVRLPPGGQLESGEDREADGKDLVQNLCVTVPENMREAVREKLEAARRSYLFRLATEFTKEKDPFRVRGEDNLFRYRKVGKVAIRTGPKDDPSKVMLRVLAASLSGVSFDWLFEEESDWFVRLGKFAATSNIAGSIAVEGDREFCRHLKEYDRILYTDPSSVPESVYRAAAEETVFIVRHPPFMEGRLELLNYFEEQCVSYRYHRYGNLGRRGWQDRQ